MSGYWDGCLLRDRQQQVLKLYTLTTWHGQQSFCYGWCLDFDLKIEKLSRSTIMKRRQLLLFSKRTLSLCFCLGLFLRMHSWHSHWKCYISHFPCILGILIENMKILHFSLSMHFQSSHWKILDFSLWHRSFHSPPIFWPPPTDPWQKNKNILL